MELFSPLYISIDGNIGAGKSTLLSRLEKQTLFTKRSVYCLPEPVDRWGGLLERFYSSPKSYAFEFQMDVLRTRMEQHFEIDQERSTFTAEELGAKKYRDVVITERSMETSLHVFVEDSFRRQGLLTETEVQIYRRWHDTALRCTKADVSVIVYVKTPPEVCIERISKRARKGEEHITLETLDHLHSLHEEYVAYMEKERGVHVVICDGTNIDACVEKVLHLLDALDRPCSQMTEEQDRKR